MFIQLATGDGGGGGGAVEAGHGLVVGGRHERHQQSGESPTRPTNSIVVMH